MIIKNTIPINSPIHKGLNTHHQDHVIYPVSFNPINKTANRPGNPTPLLDELELLIFYVFAMPPIWRGAMALSGWWPRELFDDTSAAGDHGPNSPSNPGSSYGSRMRQRSIQPVSNLELNGLHYLSRSIGEPECNHNDRFSVPLSMSIFLKRACFPFLHA